MGVGLQEARLAQRRPLACSRRSHPCLGQPTPQLGTSEQPLFCLNGTFSHGFWRTMAPTVQGGQCPSWAAQGPPGVSCSQAGWQLTNCLLVSSRGAGHCQGASVMPLCTRCSSRPECARKPCPSTSSPPTWKYYLPFSARTTCPPVASAAAIHLCREGGLSSC